MIIKIVLFKDGIKIKELETNEYNWKLHKKVLQHNNKLINDELKELKEEGIIKSIRKPVDKSLLNNRKLNGIDKSFRKRKTNTQMQDYIDELIIGRQTILDSIDKINIYFKS